MVKGQTSSDSRKSDQGSWLSWMLMREMDDEEDEEEEEIRWQKPVRSLTSRGDPVDGDEEEFGSTSTQLFDTKGIVEKECYSERKNQLGRKPAGKQA
ncbi:hypothetical protein F511_07489 [Dorcoceras hygrometricum]|uniref:Uncharacterized protein n=1 Tax=Dorcoceras hygrometricum TaxID=472368 RepID=A0A2Z7D6H7_9LAMI|nr:hypothetical protein F511_07489 [Dorcoceras hygrometricum]